MNIEIKKTGSITRDEIQKYIESQLGKKIKNLFYHIEETGDVDRGTFERKLKKIDFEIIDNGIL